MKITAKVVTTQLKLIRKVPLTKTISYSREVRSALKKLLTYLDQDPVLWVFQTNGAVHNFAGEQPRSNYKQNPLYEFPISTHHAFSEHAFKNSDYWDLVNFLTQKYGHSRFWVGVCKSIKHLWKLECQRAEFYSFQDAEGTERVESTIPLHGSLPAQNIRALYVGPSEPDIQQVIETDEKDCGTPSQVEVVASAEEIQTAWRDRLIDAVTPIKGVMLKVQLSSTYGKFGGGVKPIPKLPPLSLTTR